MSRNFKTTLHNFLGGAASVMQIAPPPSRITIRKYQSRYRPCQDWHNLGVDMRAAQIALKEKYGKTIGR